MRFRGPRQLSGGKGLCCLETSSGVISSKGKQRFSDQLLTVPVRSELTYPMQLSGTSRDVPGEARHRRLQPKLRLLPLGSPSVPLEHEQPA